MHSFGALIQLAAPSQVLHCVLSLVTDAGKAANDAVKSAEERLGGAARPAELDEFGRDIGMDTHNEETRRLERRAARDRQCLVRS